LFKRFVSFCFNYSLLIEEFIVNILENENVQFAIVSAGSFSRRELAPYSDIDLMFITENAELHKASIKKCIQLLWDCGIEASHTVGDFSDIASFIEDDLTTVTQFLKQDF
jgi:[protein-PII] uridylyltransferase